jgi:hypothetical protein
LKGNDEQNHCLLKITDAYTSLFDQEEGKRLLSNIDNIAYIISYGLG